jgi:hypothetical protein
MSGSKVPYHLRVNKYVDRQLFIEVLDHVARYQSLGNTAYISMGGGYLEDFRVLHQAFGIRHMLSFDYEDWMISRQRVNRPYGFIDCERASSGEIVSAFDENRNKLVGPDGGVIVWLDYTEADMRKSQLQELELLCAKLIHGDVFRITMNAHRSKFGSNDKFQMLSRLGDATEPLLVDWWQRQLEEQLAEYMPPERRDSQYMDSDLEFAITLARAAKMAAQAGIRPRQTLVIEPMLSVVYADGQQMITLTGLVLSADRREEFRERSRWSEWPYKPGDEWDNYVCLAVPHLSVRERSLIHALIPRTGDAAYVQHLEFRLDSDPDEHGRLIGQYVDHHRRYPTFAPVDSM